MEWIKLYGPDRKPTGEDITAFIGSQLWEDLHNLPAGKISNRANIQLQPVLQPAGVECQVQEGGAFSLHALPHAWIFHCTGGCRHKRGSGS